MLLFWLIFGTARANDITSTCAAAFRLTLKGYVSNGKDPSKVCSPPPATCRRPGGIYHMYCKQCAGYVMGKNVFNPLWPTGNITWIESTTLGHGKTARLLASAQRARWVTITVLRHPIDRIVAHARSQCPRHRRDVVLVVTITSLTAFPHSISLRK